jgi:hypothetical protein
MASGGQLGDTIPSKRGEIRGKNEVHRRAKAPCLQGESGCAHAVTVCLPCRRSWVRVPSAACEGPCTSALRGSHHLAAAFEQLDVVVSQAQAQLGVDRLARRRGSAHAARVEALHDQGLAGLGSAGERVGEQLVLAAGTPRGKRRPSHHSNVTVRAATARTAGWVASVAPDGGANHLKPPQIIGESAPAGVDRLGVLGTDETSVRA